MSDIHHKLWNINNRNLKAILNSIKKQIFIKKIFVITCYAVIVVSIASYSGVFFKNKNSFEYIKNRYQKQKDNLEFKKIIKKPKIRFEREDDVYYIEADDAVYSNDYDAVLNNVTAYGSVGTLTSKKVTIRDNGNKIIFTGKPELILNNIDKVNE